MGVQRKKTVLLADDDQFLIQGLVDALEQAGYYVLTSKTGEETLRKIRQRGGRIDVAVLDVMMPWGKTSRNLDLERLTGLSVARQLKKEYPRIKLIGMSVLKDETVAGWFETHASAYLHKPVTTAQVLDAVHFAVYRKPRRLPRCFIVHGHDEEALHDLRSYLELGLGISEVVVLREQPQLGRTLIEKFEETASNVDVVFVLLTPDDTVHIQGTSRSRYRRARQNVIFELGYFYAQMQRTRGKVILLYKGSLELPSDLSGVAYIDITTGVKQAAAAIRRELAGWL